jgi:hypothetical protein
LLVRVLLLQGMYFLDRLWRGILHNRFQNDLSQSSMGPTCKRRAHFL